MEVEGYLIIKSTGSCRFVKGRVGLDWNEVMMKINLEIPDSVFKRPMLEANIKIDGELNHKFDYEIKRELEDVLKTLPNIHLTKIDVIKTEKEEDLTYN